MSIFAKPNAFIHSAKILLIREVYMNNLEKPWSREN